VRSPREPLLWTLFSAGGTITAFVLPALVALLWIAAPLGWTNTLGYDELLDLVRHPLARLLLFGLIGLSLFHWAHRFRYTLYDGLQLVEVVRVRRLPIQLEGIDAANRRGRLGAVNRLLSTRVGRASLRSAGAEGRRDRL
jgi:fumarate reductase subunit D